MNDEPVRRGAGWGDGLVLVSLVAAALYWLVREGGMRWPDASVARWLAVAGIVAAYAALCVVAIAKSRRVGALAAEPDDGSILVAFATQTGFAEELATQTALALRGAGHVVTLRSLAQVDLPLLSSMQLAFFIVATYGEGDEPDSARRFVRDTLGRAASLDGLRFGLLALGDRTYANYCGFGRTVETWLSTRGARTLFPSVDVDNGASEALARWHADLRPWTGADVGQALALPRFDAYRLVDRRLTNDGSVGAPVFRLALEAAGDAMPPWQAGDIAVVRLPDGHLREYSIASLPSDHRLELLVRRALRPDGLTGFGAQWLTETLAIGATTALRVRANHGFRLEGLDPRTPLILIGNGTGIAGLRAHLKARVARRATRNWLVFGERHAAVDNHYGDELDAWRTDGSLERVSYAFSRDTDRRVHVQDVLRDERADVGEWIAAGAVVLVCGSASGMASGVDAALNDIVGASVVEEMAADGRYRRDVY